MNINYIVFILIQILFINCIKSEDKSSLENFNETIKCGSAVNIIRDCFKNPLPPDEAEFLQTTKIPLNEKEISTKCTVFKKGMACFNTYTQKCLSEDRKALYENTISGAKKFENKLCDDKRFQADFLTHKECFIHIKEDWNRCMKNFQSILADELNSPVQNAKHKNDKYMQFCCTRFAYETCIYNSARYKCYKNSALFAKEVARLLSDETHFKSCRHYENLLCVGCFRSSINFILLVISSILIFLFC
ncbi:uncharacterized protein LOC129607163 [Condylostylus longicornis]|uniref:uncharacterized protein LOC129607163 n=1 Tax=Condylostylus longicornis TaxID=2530218 RepID=UPI00244E3FBF|nr:uncharacterized protein LOC129607163 [Condylostylus longicornis]